MSVLVTGVYPSPLGADPTITATLTCSGCGRSWPGRMEDATFDETQGVVKGGRFVAEPFRCPVCKKVNRQPMDMAEGYCGNCHDWTRL
jgi:hypothetical protein